MLNQMSFKPALMDRSSTVAPYAHSLYGRARWIHLRKQLSGALFHRSRRLLVLDETQAPVATRYAGGTQAVALNQIRGSVDKAYAFDIDFYPAQETTENRWIQVATAFLRGVSLPPVELIQVGDIYFVVDGHHRISVARTLDYTHIDATVTVWEMV